MTIVKYIGTPKCGFAPIQNYVVVLPDPEVAMSPCGIVIPPVAREKVLEGLVVAVGPGVMRKSGVRVPVLARVGQRVTYTIVRHTPFEYDGSTFLIMREPEILVVHE